VVSVLLHGFVDFLFIVSPQFTVLFWLILALVVVADRWPGRNPRHMFQEAVVAR